MSHSLKLAIFSSKKQMQIEVTRLYDEKYTSKDNFDPISGLRAIYRLVE